jgi:type III pantothenate kinase
MTADPNFDPAAFIALAVGNTRARAGLVRNTTVHDPAPIDLADPHAAANALADLADKSAARDVLLASVNPPAADALADLLESAHNLEVHRFGKHLPIPLALALDDTSTVGQDRLLCALAAYSRAKQACIVIDAGTAITVDFVDGQGVFQGGVIAPGLRMMLDSLHQHTAALPSVDLAKPDDARGVFGKDTRHAMLLGVRNAAIGLARYTAERYAEAYEAYPQIIATGGDAPLLFDNDQVVEHIVPDLQLQGIAEAAALLLKADATHDASDED